MIDNAETLLYGNINKIKLLLGSDYSQVITLADRTDKVFNELSRIKKRLMLEGGDILPDFKYVNRILVRADRPCIVRQSIYEYSVYFREGNCIVNCYGYRDIHDSIQIAYNEDIGYADLCEHWDILNDTDREKLKNIMEEIYNKKVEFNIHNLTPDML